jgi:YD repeat-containing protein
MGWQFNPFTGQLDQTGSGGSSSGPVLLCPFDPRSSLAFSYDGSGNITTLTYTYGGTTQGYADFAYDGSGNLSTITYKGSNHTTVLRTLTFSYSSGTMTGYTVS